MTAPRPSAHMRLRPAPACVPIHLDASYVRDCYRLIRRHLLSGDAHNWCPAYLRGPTRWFRHHRRNPHNCASRASTTRGALRRDAFCDICSEYYPETLEHPNAPCPCHLTDQASQTAPSISEDDLLERLDTLIEHYTERASRSLA